MHVISRLNSPAYACPYRRFAHALTDTDARPGAIVARYAFDVGLFHPLLHAGLSRRSFPPWAPLRMALVAPFVAESAARASAPMFASP